MAEKPITSGAHFAKLYGADPSTAEALGRIRGRLSILSRAVAVAEKGDADLTAKLAEARGEIVEEIAGSIERAGAALKSCGFEPPGTDLERWEHIARIVGVGPDSRTLTELLQEALAWSDRQRLQHRDMFSRREHTWLRRGKAIDMLEADPNISDADLADKLGVQHSTISRDKWIFFGRSLALQGMLGDPRRASDGEPVEESHPGDDEHMESLDEISEREGWFKDETEDESDD
jgi:hypothetical protein